jgi:hypothetical protein
MQFEGFILTILIEIIISDKQCIRDKNLDVPTYAISPKKYNVACEKIGSEVAIFQNISVRKGGTSFVRHLFCLLKARGDSSSARCMTVCRPRVHKLPQIEIVYI